MFNNVVLDVFIGLVLLYLLYSLLLTIVTEILATWLNLRARILRLSIEKMLNDGYITDRIRPKKILPWLLSWLLEVWVVIQRFFLREFKAFKNSFAGKFYQVPSIKYLTSSAGEPRGYFTQTKPSYISAENFTESLLQLLKQRGSGNAEMDKVQFALKYNSHHIQLSSLKQLRELADTSPDVEAFKKRIADWYNETQDRANGWYKRKLGLILFWLGFIMAIIFNVDSIRIAQILAKDKQARDQLVAMGIQLAKDSTRYQDFVTAKGDTVHPKALLDTSYSRVMQDIDDANLAVGLGWGTDRLTKLRVFEIDSTKKKGLYKAISAADIDRFNKLNNSFITIANSSLSLDMNRDSVNQQLQNAIIDTIALSVALVVADEMNKKNLQLRIDSAKKRIDTLQQRLGLLKEKDNSNVLAARVALKQLDILRRNINSITGGNFALIESVQYDGEDLSKIIITGKRNYKWYEKLGYVLGKSFGSLSFIGFFITALMLSLGAPFWFDLLKKLVALRGAGIKPEEKKVQRTPNEDAQPGRAVNIPGVPRVPVAPVTAGLALAVKIVRDSLADVQGIVSVEEGFIKQNGIKTRAVEIHVKDNTSKGAAFNIAGNNCNGFPLNYLIVTLPKTHNLDCGSEISNMSKANGSGTLGCFLKRSNSQDVFLLSCWHVVKADSDWWGDPGQPEIINVQGNTIGRISDGTLSNTFDVGIAQYTSTGALSNINQTLRITKDWRAVTSADAVNEIEVHFCGKVSRFKDAVIYNHNVEKSLTYPDRKDYLMTDLFSLTVYDAQGNPTSPSSEGDSGSVVVDKEGSPLGVLIGGDDKFSYVVKFSNFLADSTPYSDYSIII